ncbi:translation initiation factor IF-2 [Cebus imitator]|uniref:translation initiation factor IF-2 n=1 Tax=Cebus imitator TaxID=2715852 RepID=UPI000809CCF5|nr:translation initiation factor IF-2 [Cebus imitator]
MVHPGGPRRLGAAFRFLHPPPPLKNSTAKCKALALPAPRRRLQPRPGGYICQARPPPTGPRGPQRLGARAAVVVVPGRTARPAAQAPSQAAGLALGAARTSAHTPVGEGPAPRPPPPTRPPGWGEERRGEGSGKGRAPLADEPHLSNVENPNTSFKHLGNIQPRCAARMRPSPLPQRRPRPPPHSRPSRSRALGAAGPEAGLRGGVALPVTFARGEGRGGDSDRSAGAGTADEEQTLLGVFGTWRQSLLRGADARRETQGSGLLR